MKLSFKRPQKSVLIFLGIIGVGLLLRLINVWDTFFVGYDQARDAQRIFEIIYNGDFKIVGPETDIPGIFNGPFLYYFLAPFYFISQFDPNFAVIGLILMNLIGCICMYYTGSILFNKKVGVLAAIFWAISYEQVNFSRYISNASFMPLMASIFFLGLAIYIFQKRPIGLIISAIGLGIAIHVNFYLLYLGLFYPLFWLIYRYKLTIPTVLKTAATLLAILSFFILAEIKFKFLGIQSLLTYFAKESGANPIIDSVARYIESYIEVLNRFFFSFNTFIILLVFTTILIYVWKQTKSKEKLTFLYLWLFSTLPLFSFKSSVLTGNTIHSSIAGAIMIFFAYTAHLLYEKKQKVLSYALIAIIVFTNLSLMVKHDFKNIEVLGYQRMIYSEQKAAIDYTYNQSQQKEFSICAVTNPLFINTLWSYLYKIYGEKKYGYLPQWSGQKPHINSTFLPYYTGESDIHYLIIEPLVGIPYESMQATIFREDQVSTLIEEKTFGEIRVQKRRITKGEHAYVDSQQLDAKDQVLINDLNRFDPRYSCVIIH